MLGRVRNKQSSLTVMSTCLLGYRPPAEVRHTIALERLAEQRIEGLVCSVLTTFISEIKKKEFSSHL